MKKTLAILLVLAMLIGVFSGMTITSGAASADTAQTGNGIGTTGTCTWQYVEYQHRLTINGNGAMENYSGIDAVRPWDAYTGDENFSVVIGPGVTLIGDFAFANAKVESIRFSSQSGMQTNDRLYPGKLTRIGKGAFYFCTNLTQFEAPEGLQTIDESAFQLCSRLKDVQLNWGLKTIGKFAFFNSALIPQITVPSSVTTIGEYGLGANREGFLIRGGGTDSVEANYAKHYQINYEDYFEIYGDSAKARFNEVTGQLKITPYENQTGGVIEGSWTGTYDLFDPFWGDIESLDVAQGINSIGDYAFSGLINLHTAVMYSVTEIGAAAFSHCRKLRNVPLLYIPIDTIRAYAFYDCPLIKDTVLPSGISFIGEMAFGYWVDYLAEQGESEKKMDEFTIVCIGDENGEAQRYCDENGFDCFTRYLQTPVITTINNTFNGVRLYWNTVEGAPCYVVERLDPENAEENDWTELGFVTDRTYFDSQNLTGDKVYQYRVWCVTKGHGQILSLPSEGAAINYIKAPAIKGISNVEGGQEVSWNTVNGASSFIVYLKGASGWEKIATTPYTKYTYPKVTDKTTYTYTIVALSGGVRSGFDPDGKSKKYLAPPTVKSLINIKDGMRVTWTATPGAKKYALFHGVGSNKNWTKVGVFTGTSGDDTMLKKNFDGEKIFYTVRAIDSNGQYLTGYKKTGWYQIYYVTPHSLTRIHALDKVRLAWKGGEKAKGWYVYRRLSSEKNWTYLGKTAKAQYDDSKNLTSGASYYYTVKAVDKNGRTSGFEPVGWSYSYIKAPRIDKVTNVSSGIKLRWSGYKGGSYYVILRRTVTGNSVSGWSTKFVIKKPADTQKTDTTAKKGVTYQYGFATGKYVKENGKNVLKLTSGIRTSSKITATRK